MRTGLVDAFFVLAVPTATWHAGKWAGRLITWWTTPRRLVTEPRSHVRVWRPPYNHAKETP